jgi:4-hydroxybenzoate polyprenyltransferase
MNRWITYQRERFPLEAHGPLVAAFSASAVCYSSLLRGNDVLPGRAALLVAFVTSLLFFLQLRIADEFKDFEDDSTYRPSRAVPRGLVTLPELARVGIGGAAIQLLLALLLDPTIIWILAVAWVYLALMTREFFVARWLKQHPVLYMTSHMMILPLVDLYATACDWWVVGLRQPPQGLLWFLVVSYFNGMVVEIGRKIRVPADEERGVDTYSALWGRARAVRAWLFVVLLTALAAWRAAAEIGTEGPMVMLLTVLVALCVGAGVRVSRSEARGAGKAVEVMAGLWTVFMYLGLGAIPVLVAWWR